MPTFKEAMKLAKQAKGDNTSSKRFKEILGILKKHDAIHGLDPQKAVSILEDLGPTFMKLGQIASMHPDMLPKEFCDAFAELRANAKAMDFDTVRKAVESELGSPLEDIFSEFDERALGSASIAQVHRAVIKESGIEVAVKVQRPGIAVTMAEDLTLMQKLLSMYEFVEPAGKEISFRKLVDELVRTTDEELDFSRESSNLQRFKSLNADRPGVMSPTCYPQYSTRSLLVMDFAVGDRIGDDEAREAIPAEKRDKLADLIARNYVQQVIEDGFFHADPHAGNVLISHDSDSIEWIDFGMMGELGSHDRDALESAMLSIAKQDAYGLKKALLEIAKPKGPIDHSKLLDKCDSLLSQYCDTNLDSFDTGGLMQGILDMLDGNGLEIPPGIFMLSRGLVTLEGTIRMLSSNVSVVGVITDYLEGSFDVDRAKGQVRNLMTSGVDSVKAAAEIPSKLSDTLDMLQKGQIKVSSDLHLDKTSRMELSDSIDHFTLAIIAGALFVGSCILCLTGLEPRFLGVPALGMLGFVSGLAIAIFDFWHMRRTKKKRK